MPLDLSQRLAALADAVEIDEQGPALLSVHFVVSRQIDPVAQRFVIFSRHAALATGEAFSAHDHVLVDRETVGARHVAQPPGAGLGLALLRLPIHRDEAKGRLVAQHPLEIVEGRPVSVAAHIQAVLKTGFHALQRAPDVGDAPGVVLRANAVLGDDDGDLGDINGATNRGFQRLRPEFIAHLGQLNVLLLRRQRPFGAKALAGVRLHADEVIAAHGLQEDVVDLAPHARSHDLTARPRLDILDRQ